jgi:hypothetical protein
MPTRSEFGLQLLGAIAGKYDRLPAADGSERPTIHPRHGFLCDAATGTGAGIVVYCNQLHTAGQPLHVVVWLCAYVLALGNEKKEG